MSNLYIVRSTSSSGFRIDKTDYYVLGNTTKVIFPFFTHYLQIKKNNGSLRLITGLDFWDWYGTKTPCHRDFYD